MSSTSSTSGSRLARSLNLAGLLAVIAYPFAIYFGLGRFSPRIMIAGLLVLLGLRMYRASNDRGRLPYLVGGLGVVIIAARSPSVGLRAYPILISLTLASVFAYSLLWPPTIIEQIARMRRPRMPPRIVAYLRNVTIVWTGFFLLNAAISTATVVSGSIKLWTLYNGFVSYLIIGAILAGELLLRPVADDLPGNA
ncbi:MAG: hypothetical protein ACLQBA_19380 [Candidatus Binataceae bacterium]